MKLKEMLLKAGIQKSVSSLADECGISVHALHDRLKRGMSLEDALKTPVQARKITYNGETLSVREWAERYGLTATVLNGRLARHSFEEAVQIPPRAGKGLAPVKKSAVAVGQTYDIGGKKYRCDRIGQCAAGPLVFFTVIGPGVRETFTRAQLQEVGLKVS
jgi:hypothetical protein